MKTEQAIRSIERMSIRKDDIIIINVEQVDTAKLAEGIREIMKNRNLFFIVLGKGQSIRTMKDREARALYEEMKKRYEKNVEAVGTV